MRYIDSGSRNPADALGTWLQDELTPDVRELRWQSGFFSEDGLPPFVPTLQRLAAANLPVHVLIGSNQGDTLQAHVARLAGFLGLPRTAAQFGIVSYGGAYYHPKTYHLRRGDGTQAAYVGSANLTFAGVSSLHVEAGVLLDTQQGDPAAVLNAIADSVDEWFSAPPRPCLEVVSGPEDVERLTAAGLLSAIPTPGTRVPEAAGGGAAPPGLIRPRLQPLIHFPGPGAVPAAPLPVIAPAGPILLPAVPRDPYPPYVLFAPGAVAPTTGIAALSGSALPGGYAGLVVQLNRDSSRHWRGGSGTANISIPVPTVSTLRFGMFQGQRPRPRAEYGFDMRYLYPSIALRAGPTDTNVMVYGYAGDPGHGDVRMVVPVRPAREIAMQVQQHARVMPAEGDVALLEWPTGGHPSFRLTSPRTQLAVVAASGRTPGSGRARAGNCRTRSVLAASEHFPAVVDRRPARSGVPQYQQSLGTNGVVHVIAVSMVGLKR